MTRLPRITLSEYGAIAKLCPRGQRTSCLISPAEDNNRILCQGADRGPKQLLAEASPKRNVNWAASGFLFSRALASPAPRSWPLRPRSARYIANEASQMCPASVLRHRPHGVTIADLCDRGDQCIERGAVHGETPLPILVSAVAQHEFAVLFQCIELHPNAVRASVRADVHRKEIARFEPCNGG